MLETEELRMGASDERVVTLKQNLNDLVSPPPRLAPDNKFDRQTQAAVVNFQRQFRVGLPHGAVDAYTWVAMSKALTYKHDHGAAELRGANLAFLVQEVTPQRVSTCSLSAPDFDKLAGLPECAAALGLLKRSFGDGAKAKYEGWSVHDRAVFLNTLAAVADAKVNLTNAKFHAFYHSDRPERPSFGVEVAGVDKKDFGDVQMRYAKPFGVIPTPIKLGYRSPSNVKIASVEASPKQNGVVAFDVDLANPFGNFGEHQKEVDENKRTKKTTDPRDVVRLLNQRGVKSGVNCQ